MTVLPPPAARIGPLLRTLGAAVSSTVALCSSKQPPRIFLSAEHRSRSHITVDRNLAPAIFFGDATNDAERAACGVAEAAG